MSNVSGSNISNNSYLFPDLKLKKIEKRDDISEVEKLSNNEAAFKNKSKNISLEDDLDELENLHINENKINKINYFSREKYFSNDNRTLEEFKTLFLKIESYNNLTKDEIKDYKELKKLVVSNTKPRELLRKIDDLSTKIKTDTIKKMFEEYKELNIKSVFSSIDLNSDNIKVFISNFKKVTKHDGIFFDNNKNIKDIYSSLDSLANILDNDNSNFKLKISAINEIKSEINKFVINNKNSSKIQWVKLLDDFLGEVIKLENDKLSYADALTEHKLKTDLFSKAQKDLGKTFNIINEFNSRHESIKNFSKPEDSFLIEQRLMKDIQNSLSLMTNEEFLDIYKAITSSSMNEFRVKLLTIDKPLTKSFLEDLNNFEVMVYTELANRTFSKDNKSDKLNNAGLAIISEVENIGSKKILNSQTDKALKGEESFTDIDPKAKEKLDKYGINPKEFIEYMKSSDLTINVSPNFFLGDTSPFFDKNGNIIESNLHVKNIFEIVKENPDIIDAKGGDFYLNRRKIAEHLEFPILEKIDNKNFEHNNHPVSAALNVGKKVDGAAGGYGQMFFVLKDDVKNRCTYTPLDSFYTNKILLNKETISSFKEVVKEAFKNNKNLDELLNRIDYLEDANFDISIKNNFLDYLSAGVNDILSPEEQGKIRLLALKHLSDKSVLAHMGNTMNNISNIINDLNEEQLKEISIAIKNKERINLKIGNNLDYIEAQIHGGVNFLKDVKEIRVNSNIDKYQKSKIEKLAKHLGVEVKYFETKDTEKELLSMDPTKYNKVPKINIKANEENKFREKELFNLLDKYKEHEKTFDKEAGYHGRRHITRALIFSNILSNILKEKGAEIDTSLVFRATALHDSGREANGKDIFENKSANNLQDYLVELGVDNAQYLKLAKACIDSDQSKYNESLEMGILKSADSLDISRARDYDPKYLWFMKNDIKIGEDKYIKVDNELRNKIIEEAIKFTSATDPLYNIRLINEARSNVVTIELMDNKEEELQNYMNNLESILGKGFDNSFKNDSINSKLDKIQSLLLDKLSEFKNKILEMNNKSSKELFESIENELLSGKYPTLKQYYDKEFKFSFPQYPDEDMLINKTLENISNKPLNQKIVELDKLYKSNDLSFENKKKIKNEISKLINDNLNNLNSPEFIKNFKKLTNSRLIGIYSKLENLNKLNKTTDKIEKLQDLIKTCQEYNSSGLDKDDILNYFVENLKDNLKIEKHNLFNHLSDEISLIDSDKENIVDKRSEIAKKVSSILPKDDNLISEYLNSLSNIDKEKRTKVLSNITADINNFKFKIYNKTELKQFTDLVVNSDLTNNEILTFLKKLNINNIDLRAEIIKNLAQNNKLNLEIFLDYAIQDFVSEVGNPDIVNISNDPRKIEQEYQNRIKKAEKYILESEVNKKNNLKSEVLPYIQQVSFKERNSDLEEFFKNKNETLDPMQYLLPLNSMMAYSSFFNIEDKNIQDFALLVLKLKNYASINSKGVIEYASNTLRKFDFEFFNEFSKILKKENKEEMKLELNELLKKKELKFIPPQEQRKLNDNEEAMKVINEFLFKEIE